MSKVSSLSNAQKKRRMEDTLQNFRQRAAHLYVPLDATVDDIERMVGKMNAYLFDIDNFIRKNRPGYMEPMFRYEEQLITQQRDDLQQLLRAKKQRTSLTYWGIYALTVTTVVGGAALLLYLLPSL